VFDPEPIDPPAAATAGLVVTQRRLLRRGSLLRRPISVIAWGLLGLFLFVAILAPVLAPYNPTATTGAPLLKIGAPGHLLGTDSFGRDELSRAIYGARPLIATSLLAVLLAVVFGFAIGLVSGYFGRYVDTGLMRAMDVILSFPLILLAIMIVAALGAGLVNLVIAIGISQLPVCARLARALTARETPREYVLAAKTSGFRVPRVLLREIAPNVLGPIVVQATAIVAVAAGYAAALSYLGLGIQPPTADWGYMVKEGQEFIFVAPRLVLIPGILITLFVMACNFVGDDLRDLLAADREF
jgi:peptide/nickel transport system permease protein